MSYKYAKNLGKNSSARSSYGYGSGIDGITVHHWGSTGQKHQNVVDWLRGYTGNRGSSAHYVVSDGLVTQIVEDSRASWHGGSNKANGTTIGIEMRPEMSDGDWETLVELCVSIEEKHGSMKYYGHKDWKATACPGDYYDRLGELVDAVNEYKKTGKIPDVTKGGNSTAGAGGSSKKYKTVDYGTTLGLYDKGAPVEEWQKGALGYSDEDADGYFGPQTEGDTEDFQEAHGLVADGLVGEKTWAAFKDGDEAPEEPETAKKSGGDAPKFPLRSGHYFGPKSWGGHSHSGYYNHRSDMREWQQQMQDRGWSLDVDGLYGRETNKITKQFQAEKGLKADGLIGPKTWAAAWTEPVT
ncbi:MAG: peptidoglycan recognition protein family protein [Brevibacterium sp.]